MKDMKIKLFLLILLLFSEIVIIFIIRYGFVQTKIISPKPTPTPIVQIRIGTPAKANNVAGESGIPR
jgi:hypothetical protein